MTRKQEIEEMAKMKASHITSDKDMQVAFADALRSGAQWADSHPHWISVEDKKPKLKYENDGFQYSEAVIVTDGKYRTSANWVHNIWAGWYCWLTGGDEELKGITHWMPMPSVEHLKD